MDQDAAGLGSGGAGTMETGQHRSTRRRNGGIVFLNGSRSLALMLPDRRIAFEQCTVFQWV